MEEKSAQRLIRKEEKWGLCGFRFIPSMAEVGVG